MQAALQPFPQALCVHLMKAQAHSRAEALDTVRVVELVVIHRRHQLWGAAGEGERRRADPAGMHQRVDMRQQHAKGHIRRGVDEGGQIGGQRCAVGGGENGLLFLEPESDCNLAVVEIKLASNTDKDLKADLEKLALFRRALRYETLVEILIGSDQDLIHSRAYLDRLRFDCDIPIHVLAVSTDNRQATIFRVNDPTSNSTSA